MEMVYFYETSREEANLLSLCNGADSRATPGANQPPAAQPGAVGISGKSSPEGHSSTLNVRKHPALISRSAEPREHPAKSMLNQR